ncbi:hypothetical protein FKP32DRAFT_1754978 [Trametes sanguinea]|nr:hypothetical protein FKP32DRAFT_1754978 [Trametes sanguinea]
MDSETKDDIPIAERDHQVWLKDGNIILVANRAIAFRLYKELLSCHSDFFKDMFSLARPGACPEDMMDGCPVIHVPDQPDVLRLFLLILTRSGFGTPRWLKIGMPRILPFCEFAALLRIAHKYQARTTLRLLVETSKLFELVATQALDGLHQLKDEPITVKLCIIRVSLVVSALDAIEILNLARFIGRDTPTLHAERCCARRRYSRMSLGRGLCAMHHCSS